MPNPEFGIRIGEITLWLLEIDLGKQKPTQLARGEIKIKVLVPDTEELYKVFSEQFLSTPGTHFSTLKSGIGSYNEVQFVLEQMSGGVWNYSQRNVPMERGEIGIPESLAIL